MQAVSLQEDERSMQNKAMQKNIYINGKMENPQNIPQIKNPGKKLTKTKTENKD